MAKSLDRSKGVNKRLFESSSNESDIFGDDSDADPDFILPTSSEEDGYNVVARRPQNPAAHPGSSKATSRSPHPTPEKAFSSCWRKRGQSSKERNKERIKIVQANLFLADNASFEQEKNEASTKRELHLRKGEALRKTLNELSIKSKENPDDIHTIRFTGDITNPKAFLWSCISFEKILDL
ncbi:hypothetical protein J6590_086650 [Homalodisca vitripennis]|nr:hypothetical protein J6590_086650 [Homalodisca vitripennis]